MVYFCLNKENSNLLHIEIKNLVREIQNDLFDLVRKNKDHNDNKSNIDKILSRKENINDIGYLKNPVSYGNDLSILEGLDLKTIIPKPAANDSITTIKELYT